MRTDFSFEIPVGNSDREIRFRPRDPTGNRPSRDLEFREREQYHQQRPETQTYSQHHEAEIPPMPVINFVKEKKKIEVPEGANLRKEAQKAGIQVYPGIHQVLHCPGWGQCASCRVLITKGADSNVKPPGWFEKLRLLLGPITFFARLGHEKELRLSCQTTVQGDIDVETQPSVNWHGEKYWA